MNSGDSDRLAQAGIRFFGRMTASISHEIKNALAIINENAGLLEDLTGRAEKGVPIESERLKTVAARITKQIRRAEGIVKTLNTFAHSADGKGEAADLNDVVRLAEGLSGRLVAMRGFGLEAEVAETPVPVSGSPFHLAALIWLCLEFGLGCGGAAGTILLSASKTASGGRVRISGFTDLAAAEAAFPAEQERALLALLGAQVILDRGAGAIVLVLPAAGGPERA